MTDIEVTVVMPCLNARAHIPRAIASVFRNLRDHTVEIIVADGGSTDGTVEYLNSQDVRLLQGPDRSLYDGLNKALSHARGEFIIWLNADDELLPGMREMLIEAKKSGCDLLSGEADTIREGELLFRTCHVVQEMTAESLLFAVPTINSRIFRASLFDRTGLFDWEIGLAADRLMLLEVLEKANSRSFFAMPVYRYHTHDGSSTMANTWASYARVHRANLALAKKLAAERADKHVLEATHACGAVSRLGAVRAAIMQGKIGELKETLVHFCKNPASFPYLLRGIRAQRKLRGKSSGW